MLSQVQCQCITPAAKMEYSPSWNMALRMCQESAVLTGMESTVKESEVKENQCKIISIGQISRFLVQNVFSKQWLH